MAAHNANDVPAPGGSVGLPRWVRWLAIAALLVMATIVLLPTLLSLTGILPSLLNNQLAAHDIRASMGSTQLGWTKPAAFRDVRISDYKETWEFSVAELGSELSLWQMLTSAGDLGSFVIDQPTIVVSMDQPIELPESETGQAEPPSSKRTTTSRRFRIQIKDGTILVKLKDQDQPVEFARQIHLTADWETSPDGRVLQIEPGTPLDHVQLTPEMCDTGLKFVAPIFGDVAWSSGSLSLELDTCQIPLDHPRAADVAGRVSLHAVETGLKNPVAVKVANVAARVLKKDLPDAVKLADNSVIEFQVKDAQVTHRGLEFGLPSVSKDLVIRTEGTVGFDGDLDLLAEIPLPLALLSDGPLAKALGNQTLSLPIQGSLDEPQLNLKGDGQLASGLISELLNPVVSGDLKVDDVLESIRELRDQRRERREERGSLFERIRERRRDRSDDPE